MTPETKAILFGAAKIASRSAAKLGAFWPFLLSFGAFFLTILLGLCSLAVGASKIAESLSGVPFDENPPDLRASETIDDPADLKALAESGAPVSARRLPDGRYELVLEAPSFHPPIRRAEAQTAPASPEPDPGANILDAAAVAGVAPFLFALVSLGARLRRQILSIRAGAAEWATLPEDVGASLVADSGPFLSLPGDIEALGRIPPASWALPTLRSGWVAAIAALEYGALLSFALLLAGSVMLASLCAAAWAGSALVAEPETCAAFVSVVMAVGAVACAFKLGASGAFGRTARSLKDRLAKEGQDALAREQERAILEEIPETKAPSSPPRL